LRYKEGYENLADTAVDIIVAAAIVIVIVMVELGVACDCACCFRTYSRFEYNRL